MKKLIGILGAICLLMTNIVTLGEGLLPQLGEIYGVGMPSFGDIVLGYPDSIETTADGKSIERFSNVAEEHYTEFGNYLGRNGCELLNYNVEGTLFRATIKKDNKTFEFEYDIQQGEVVLTYPKGTFDKRVNEAEALYMKAQDAISEGNYEEAYAALTSITDYTQYKDVSEIISENAELRDERNKVNDTNVFAKGSKGPEVKALQQKLIDLGYLAGTADGDFGKMTEDAIKNAQADFGLEQTGIADDSFMARLNE